MSISTAIIDGIVMPVNATNNILPVGRIATTTSEHFAHALLDHGCVVPVTLGMYLLWSSTTNESTESAF